MPSVKLARETAAAFDRYVAQAEARIEKTEARNSKIEGGELRIESAGAAADAKVRGGMIQDWIGTMFVRGATVDQARTVLQDYASYKIYYAPQAIESKLLGHHADEHGDDEYDVFLRLHEKHILSVVLNTTYHVRYAMPDAQRLTVTSYSTRIAEVKDTDKSYDEELPVGNDSGFLWRLNTYWRFQGADGGVWARCEAISLSRDVPFGLGWMLKGFLEGFPKKSMMNTLRGTRAAVMSRAHTGN